MSAPADPPTADPVAGTAVPTAAPDPLTANIMAQVRTVISDLFQQQREEVNEALRVALRDRPDPARFEERRRRGITDYAAATSDDMRQAFLRAGMSEAEASAASMETVGLLSGNASGPTTIVPQAPVRRHHWKTDDIGTFSGKPSELITFIARVESLWDMKEDPNWREPLIEALPGCLKDTAATWYAMSSQSFRRTLTTWTAWKNALNEAFAYDPVELRQKALSRKWQFRREDAPAYFWDKSGLLRLAFPTYEPKSIIHEIKLGLPDDLQVLVRTSMARNPTVEDLLTEIRELEPSWRRMDPARRSLKESGAGGASGATSSPPARSAERASAPPGGTAAQGRRLSETYDPKNAWVDANGTRHYRIPGDPGRRVLQLNRNCGICKRQGEPNGKHFDFEHDTLVRPPNKRAASLVVEGYPAVATVEGYPAFYDETLDPVGESTSWYSDEDVGYSTSSGSTLSPDTSTSTLSGTGN
ncbi:unnamed protein product [Parajaminaea phylloscopi]